MMDSGRFDYNEYYKGVSPMYNEIRLDTGNDFQTTLNIVLKYIKHGMENILDVGCGTGKYGQALLKLGFNVQGIDKSPSQVVEAQKVINACEGNVTNLPYREKSFEVCIMIMMIHHLTTQERQIAFNEVHRVLEKDGILVIKTASHKDLEFRMSSRFFPETLQIDLKRYPSIETIKGELKNFKKIWVENAIIESSIDKNEMLYKLSKRRTSNLGMLSEDILIQGIKKFSETYKNQNIIQKESHYTFIIAQR